MFLKKSAKVHVWDGIVRFQIRLEDPEWVWEDLGGAWGAVKLAVNVWMYARAALR